MIQKIRSYLLDNKENKESIGWYVAIIMLVPLFSYFFIARNNKTSLYIGHVNNNFILKSIFQIKSYEQQILIENIFKFFGEEQASSLLSMFFQGKTPDQFLLSEEIKRLFLVGRSSALISSDLIAGKKISFDIANNSDRFKEVVGEIFYKIILGETKEFSRLLATVPIDLIDSYACEAYQIRLLKNLFQLPISILEKKITAYPQAPLKIHFTSYVYDKVKGIGYYKKMFNLDSVSEDEYKDFYSRGLKSGYYQKDRNIVFTLTKYLKKDLNRSSDTIKKELSSSLKKELEIALINKWSLLSEGTADLNDWRSILEKNFQRNAHHGNILLTLVGDEKKSSVVLPPEVLEAVQKNDALYFVIIVDDALYLIENIDKKKQEQKSFEEAKKAVLENIVLSRVEDHLVQDITQMRYSLEEGKEHFADVWKKESFVFDPLGEKKEDQGDKIFSQKLSFGALREGVTFIEENENKVTIFFVKKIEVSPDATLLRKESGVGVNIFVENSLQSAIIDIYDDARI